MISSMYKREKNWKLTFIYGPIIKNNYKTLREILFHETKQQFNVKCYALGTKVSQQSFITDLYKRKRHLNWHAIRKVISTKSQ